MIFFKPQFLENAGLTYTNGSMGSSSNKNITRNHNKWFKNGFPLLVFVLFLILLSFYVSSTNFSQVSLSMQPIYKSVTYKFENTTIDVPILQRDMSQNSNYSDMWKKGMVFHKLSECFKTAVGGGNEDASLQLQSDSSEHEFKCKHLMDTGFSRLGRTGNQLFLVAGLISIASYHNYTAIIPSALPLTSLFDLPNVAVAKLSNVAQFTPKYPGIFDKRVQNLSHQTNWTLNGYLESWMYFNGSEDVVRRAFKIKDNFAKDAEHLINLTVSSTTVTIGIHVRRGDFLLEEYRSSGCAVASANYIQKAATYFRKKYKLVHFFVASDDKKWCIDNLGWPNVTISPFSTVGHDMALLIQCDHVIVTSGTFGWWCAWLAGGETVYWTGFPSNGSSLAQRINVTHYYPNHWVGLS